MKIFEEKYNKGFTLVETILYVLLFAVVMGAIVSFGLLLSSINAKNLCMREAQANARTAFNFISSEIRSAEDVISPEFGTSSTTLTYFDQDANLKIIKLHEGILSLFVNEEEIVITRDNILISSLSFENLSVDNNSDSIQFLFDFAYRDASSKEFYYESSLRSAVTRRF